nr:MAG TPA: hypothetical protein [Crassvirales sp.]
MFVLVGLIRKKLFIVFLSNIFNLNMILTKKLLQHLKVLRLDLMMLYFFGSCIKELLKTIR